MITCPWSRQITLGKVHHRQNRRGLLSHDTNLIHNSSTYETSANSRSKHEQKNGVWWHREVDAITGTVDDACSVTGEPHKQQWAACQILPHSHRDITLWCFPCFPKSHSKGDMKTIERWPNELWCCRELNPGFLRVSVLLENIHNAKKRIHKSDCFWHCNAESYILIILVPVIHISDWFYSVLLRDSFV